VFNYDIGARPLTAIDDDMQRIWPDHLDYIAIGSFALLVVGIPAIGYLLMVADFRAYLRALRGALIIVQYHFQHIPLWARQETPACLKALGLRLPCSEEQLKVAYRKLAEQLHPDRGGDRKRFARLKAHYEEAATFIRESM